MLLLLNIWPLSFHFPKITFASSQLAFSAAFIFNQLHIMTFVFKKDRRIIMAWSCPSYNLEKVFETLSWVFSGGGRNCLLGHGQKSSLKKEKSVNLLAMTFAYCATCLFIIWAGYWTYWAAGTTMWSRSSRWLWGDTPSSNCNFFVFSVHC